MIYVGNTLFLFFFFNETATTKIYTLSLHDALPICWKRVWPRCGWNAPSAIWKLPCVLDRKSTRLNSSHGSISDSVFRLKKKKNLPDARCTIAEQTPQLGAAWLAGET